MDGLRDEVALVGVAGHADAAGVAARAMAGLTHRGGDSGGLVVGDGARFRGVWPQRVGALQDPVTLDPLMGSVAVAKVWSRVSPRRDVSPRRPVCAGTQIGPMAAALAGRLVNGPELNQLVSRQGAVRAEGTPEELLLHLAAQSTQKRVINRLVDALWRLDGAFAALLATTDTLVAVRDPRGFKPLVMGRLDGAVLFASEDVAIRAVGGEVVRDVEPGEMILVDPRGIQTTFPFRHAPLSPCAQEVVQLARLGASVGGRSVWQVREKLGSALADEGRTDADVVIPMTGDDTPAAVGLAEALQIRWARGVLAAPGVGTPSPRSAHAEGWFAVPDVVAGKRVVLVASSLGTGVTLRAVVKALRQAGVATVHVRMITPPLRRACPYGVVCPSTDELASQRGQVGASAYGVESMRWLRLPQLHKVLRTSPDQAVCDGCLSGDLPITPPSDDQLALFEGVKRRTST